MKKPQTPAVVVAAKTKKVAYVLTENDKDLIALFSQLNPVGIGRGNKRYDAAHYQVCEEMVKRGFVAPEEYCFLTSGKSAIAGDYYEQIDEAMPGLSVTETIKEVNAFFAAQPKVVLESTPGKTALERARNLFNAKNEALAKPIGDAEKFIIEDFFDAEKAFIAEHKVSLRNKKRYDAQVLTMIKAGFFKPDGSWQTSKRANVAIAYKLVLAKL